MASWWLVTNNRHPFPASRIRHAFFRNFRISLELHCSFGVALQMVYSVKGSYIMNKAKKNKGTAPENGLLYSFPDCQLYYVKARLATAGFTRKQPAKYPVSAFFYVKGAPVHLEDKNNAHRPLTQSPNTGNLFYASGNTTATWQAPGPVEFFEIKMTADFLLHLLPAEHAVWKNFRKKIQGGKAAGIHLLLNQSISLTKDIKELLYGLLKARYSIDALQQAYVQVKLAEVLLQFFDNSVRLSAAESFTRKEKTLAFQVQSFLDSLNGSGSFTIAGLADKLGTNTTTLKSAFKKVIGETIYGYYLKNKMENASSLLREGLSVSEVAGISGYKHMAHFSHMFKKYHGVAPTKIYK